MTPVPERSNPVRCRKTILFWFIPLLFGSLAFAQSGDWQAVKNLPVGTRIAVRYNHGFVRDTCSFLRATEDQLICARQARGRPRVLIVLHVPNEVVYERNRVREVRLQPGEAVGTANVLIGGAIGAGVGAGVGATANNGTLTRGGSALVAGTVGAVIGGCIGHVFPPIRGRVIYRK